MSRHRRAAACLVVSAMLVAGIATPLVFSGVPAGAYQVQTLQQKAQFIANEIQTADSSLQILDETYLQAESRVSLDAHQVSHATTEINQTEKNLSADRAHLREIAIEDYVTGGRRRAFRWSSTATSRPKVCSRHICKRPPAT